VRQPIRERRIASLDDQAWLCLQHEPEGKLLEQCGDRALLPEPQMELVWQRQYANLAEARIDIAAYIVGFYNCDRLNSVLGKLPPTILDRNMATKESIAVSEVT
jgi:hypothetical protein